MRYPIRTDAYPFDTDAFRQGLGAYRARRFFDAHEHWEELWLDEEDADLRHLLQGLIQIATALHKLLHGVAPRGCPTLLEKAVRHFAALPDAYRGMSLPPLRAAVERLRPEVCRLVEAARSDLEPALIPAIDPPAV